MKFRGFLTVLITVLLMLICGPCLADEYLPVDFDAAQPVISELKIYEGIFIDGTDVSGKTLSEAQSIIDALHLSLADEPLSVRFGDTEFAVTFGQLGLRYAGGDICADVIRYGNTGGLLGLYKSLVDLKTDGCEFISDYSIDENALRRYVSETLGAVSTAEDATITLKDGEFIITPDHAGITVDEQKTYEAIISAIEEKGPRSGIKVEGIAQVTEARVKAADLEMVTDKLGSCSTNVGGSSNRADNVALGASKINGLLLMPGESASASDLMEKRDAEHGYKKAPQYVNGKSEDAIGGGVCQVSSTLYNALLEAELQIDERHNHSMLVSYLPASQDAAISDGYKDLKFTNNTEYPIYIEGRSVNRVCTFTVYGHETRDANRKVEYKSVITSQSTPADKIVYDKNQPTTYKKTTGTRHAATKSYLEKIVYENGKEVSREVISKDSYQGSSKVITIGTKQPEVKPADPTTTPAPTVPVAPTTPAEPPSESSDSNEKDGGE